MTHVTHPIFVTHLTHDPSTHSLLWHTQRVCYLCAGRQEPLDVLRNRKVTRNVNAQHLHRAIACDSWQRCRLWYTPSLAPTVAENHLAGLAIVQP